MKYLIAALLIVSSFSYSGVLHDQTLGDVSDVHIFDGSDGPASMLPFSPWDTSTDNRVAADYVPPEGEIAELRGIAMHYCYAYDNVATGDVTVEVYETNFDSAPIAEVEISENDITETDTGWVSPTNGMKIFYGEMLFNQEDWIAGLDGGTTYWIAARMDSSNGVFCITVDHDDWQEGYWYQSFSDWHSIYYAWPGRDFDFAMKFIGGGLNSVRSASLGNVKASFQ